MADSRMYLPSQRISAASGTQIDNPNIQAYSNKPYAMNLINYAHKFKFLYLVEFFLDPSVGISGDTRFSLLTQTSTRPEPKFDYEPLNLYGARTGVLKSTKFPEMKMSFLDDQNNKMMEFYTSILRWQSPISNVPAGGQFETTQYAFNQNQAVGDDGVNSMRIKAHRYAVSSNPTPFLHSVKLHHVYDYGNLMNTYIFSKPLITDIGLDGLDMKSGDLTSMTINFDYVALSLELGKQFTEQTASLVGSENYRLIV